MSKQPVKMTAISVDDLSRILSSAPGCTVTAEQLRAIAQQAGILNGDTVNLIEYTAYLAKEVAGGAD